MGKFERKERFMIQHRMFLCLSLLQTNPREGSYKFHEFPYY